MRKVQSKVVVPARPAGGPKKEVIPVAPKKEVGGENVQDGAKEVRRQKKVCSFCKSKAEPAHWDIVALRRFVNDRGRISSRLRSGACAKHQRRVSREIKRARLLALLPFSSRI